MKASIDRYRTVYRLSIAGRHDTVLIQTDVHYPDLARDLGAIISEQLHIARQIRQAQHYLDEISDTWVEVPDEEAITNYFPQAGVDLH